MHLLRSTSTLALFFLISISLLGQAVSINNTGAPPHPSAILDVSSNTQGMLIPRVNTFPANAAEGLLVYREDLKCFFFNDGADWQIMEGAYASGDGITIDNNNVISMNISGQQAGDMMCYDGTHWLRVPKGQDGDVLVMKNGVPTWEAGTTGGSTTLPPHTVGESFGGGIIFYVDGTGTHGLIAYPSDLPTPLPWSNASSHSLIGANADAIYGGIANTAAIVNAFGPGDYAAKACDDFTGGGFTDWYLPSRFELSMLYNTRNVVGGFTNLFYWSSTEANTTDAWCVAFAIGEVLDDNKWGDARVRPIRAF